ncbi:molybdopterin molybdotransferase MoeA [Aquimarina litoralis]|uniref:molybdopterin molybdotransferase MoeA n=1 Tax=Aquimarina litoralis TaxID=584605 RepID=UPI001C56F56C|nr:gephyrin-like molybdotransferase Glp [Aquimarina litoralis]MBW1297677.1 molybdopterin molybdenumtransferase MoeA [Aquimarina litoralis]
MISVSEALSIISNISYTPKATTIALKDANGLVLSEDIHSPIHMPPFRQSAMDGYAVSPNNSNTYEIIGEVQAGSPKDYTLLPGQGVRIFTGARVPESAKSIVIQEKVQRSEDRITVDGEILINQNIRSAGEQIQKGAVALTKGTKLTPAGIGFLAGLGVTEINAYSSPTVAIITTGDELIPPGTELKEGQIYESNSIQLEAALRQLHIKKIQTYVVHDEYEQTKKTIEEAINNHELVLISGGISVGDYDFVKKALTDLEIKELFYKVKQKPGKPLFFGSNDTTHVFGLPGNPASSLTCFYIYVLPIIEKMRGINTSGLERTSKALTADFVKKGDRAQFLKAKIADQSVEILEGQSSSMLYTYAIANALVYIPENINKIPKGDLVETFILPR